MRPKWVGQVDLNTGLAQEGLVVLVAPKKTNGFRERWLAMAQEAAERVAEQRKLLGEEGLAVLFMLLARLDFENALLVNQAELGRKLGMHRQSVQQAIKKLMGVGVLLEGPKIGQNRSYKLNPEFGWKGSATNHKKTLEKQRKERMKAARITGVIENDPTK
jgi:biotin operon repressor